MKSIISTLALFAALAAAVVAQETAPRIAIIKADDLRRPTEKWQRFVAVSQEKGVKVSIGIIADSLVDAPKDYLDWIRTLDTAGQVEFWNHGWDHKRWTGDEGKELREFSGTGFEHQAAHYNKAKTIMTQVLGAAPVAFGAPFNAVDDDTVNVLKADGDLRIDFGYNARGMTDVVLAPLSLRGEHDGTGKPNFAKFVADYKNKRDVTFAAVQFHPQNFAEEHFGEYARILDFLLAEGWTFELPKGYLSRRAANN